MDQRHRIAIGLGSNLGDRLHHLRRAAAALAADPLEDAVSSSVYESPPWGIAEQPDFLNAVIVGITEWKPPGILSYLKQLERELGRVPSAKYGPRIIDLDLLAYGDGIWEGDGISVPHPRILERDFVLLPFEELWPQWRHPILGISVREMARRLNERQPHSARVIGPPLLDKASL